MPTGIKRSSARGCGYAQLAHRLPDAAPGRHIAPPYVIGAPPRHTRSHFPERAVLPRPSLARRPPDDIRAAVPSALQPRSIPAQPGRDRGGGNPPGQLRGTAPSRSPAAVPTVDSGRGCDGGTGGDDGCGGERATGQVDVADRGRRAATAGDGRGDDGLRRAAGTRGPARVRARRPAGLLGLGHS